MTDIEEALALLVAPCTDERFFQRALKALALVTQCRWAAFCRPSHKGKIIEIVAFCDLQHNLPGFEFDLQGSPCESIYQLKYPNCHILYPDGLQRTFPNSPWIKKLGANSYQAEIILNEDKTPIGHILVMDTLSQTETMKSREFFRLLAHRIAVEYNRLLISREMEVHKQMIAHTEQLMSFVDLNYQYRVISKGYKKVFNRTASSLIGTSVAELHGKDVFVDHLKPLIDRALKGETLTAQTKIHPPHLCEPIYLNIHHNPHYDDQGEIVGVIISAHKITDLHHAKER
ncbi:PAS domain-containing protein [Shewanella violacea]|uniref:PAS fold-4 domain-containing protein n=1 Tax=Shewanella violacea (strain JCM 10179 / CIP 106290 / LMG 19151 / DSS12) TaxID=637905 RepID=D4ZLH2_SHEVD|nr:PAS domain-containing protein [Shewanella violacea]BAJ02521.1 hypothetical protein SVI_2550 [Shewanella violacea DSS12]